MTWAGLGVYVFAAVLAIGSAWLYAWYGKHDALRRNVWFNLDNAYENGYFEAFGYWHGLRPLGIACELALYVDVEAKPWQLEPHVRTWMQQKGML